MYPMNLDPPTRRKQSAKPRTRHVNIRLTEEARNKLDELAIRDDQNLSDVIRELLQLGLETKMRRTR